MRTALYRPHQNIVTVMRLCRVGSRRLRRGLRCGSLRGGCDVGFTQDAGCVGGVGVDDVPVGWRVGDDLAESVDGCGLERDGVSDVSDLNRPALVFF
jgi:hypothetical protein